MDAVIEDAGEFWKHFGGATGHLPDDLLLLLREIGP
jgi:hypothetical protein